MLHANEKALVAVPADLFFTSIERHFVAPGEAIA